MDMSENKLGPLDIKASLFVKDKIREALKENKYIIFLIENERPILKGVDLVDFTNYTSHNLDVDITIYVRNRNLWELFHCSISEKVEEDLFMNSYFFNNLRGSGLFHSKI
tara:strand:- start:342 stop:671 length:330 start_codon:yes stop_codon:yes gene_type:complete